MRTTAAGPVTTPARPIAEIDVSSAAYRPTGVSELDRVLGGGLVPGAVVLLAGEPGVGKSTLLLDVAARAARSGAPSLYVTGEESAGQVRLRAERIGAVAEHLFLAAETDLATVLGQIEAVRPALVVIDSVQTMASALVEGSAGGVAQVREAAGALIQVAKSTGVPIVLVGHVTKDGSVAGPRTLEHLVDVVLAFEGDRHARLRLVRATKNRYGTAEEVGCFELHDAGIRGLPDPSGLFLSRRQDPVPGTCVTVTLEGRRPLVTEVQALVTPAAPGSPRRATSGLDSARVAMIIAVLLRHAGTALQQADTYVATVGGVKITEPGADLSIALSLATATVDLALPSGLVVIGEVGLAGDVRPVTGISRRLQEAARLGFTHAVVPPESGVAPDGLLVREVATLGQAVDLAERWGNYPTVRALRRSRSA